MTTDTLDRVGRAAAADLHARTRDVDTEAALAALDLDLGSPGGARWRPGLGRFGRPGRPVFVGAAAAILVVVLVGVALATRGSDDAPGVRTGPAAAIDPADFGPVAGTVRGLTSPTLRADLHAQPDLADGAEVAIAISGGVPGTRYGAMECATLASEAFYPPANCASLDGEVQLDAAGTGVLIVPVLAAFDPASVPFLNDCRAAVCSIQLGPRLGEDVGDQADPAVDFPDVSGDEPGLPLRFAADAVGPLPTMEVQAVRRDGEDLVVRITGSGLPAVPTDVVAEGYAERRDGPLVNAGGDIYRNLRTVEVGPDGTVDVEVTLPMELAMDPDLQASDPPQAPIRCDQAPSYCSVRLAPDPGSAGAPAHPRLLAPQRVGYPELP